MSTNIKFLPVNMYGYIIHSMETILIQNNNSIQN